MERTILQTLNLRFVVPTTTKEILYISGDAMVLPQVLLQVGKLYEGSSTVRDVTFVGSLA